MQKINARFGAVVGLAALMGMMLAAAIAASAQGQSFKVLYSFTNGADGGYPFASVVRDAAGNLYGTTSAGGAYGCGVVFKLDANNRETVLYSFTGGADGSLPYAPVVLGTTGDLYGTAKGGGTYGHGVVFKLDPSGNETVLHSFTGGADGSTPVAGLLRDAAGNLYGTTYYGGYANYGVVFKLDARGAASVLHSFTGGTDGGFPAAGLILDASGTLYGTTYLGGNLSCSLGSGCGTVFTLDAAGNETVLYAFEGGTDGQGPVAGLIQDASGTLYGTTEYGGPRGQGTVFRLDTAGVESVLYNFMSRGDGGSPECSLIRDARGNLYGATTSGGVPGLGVVFLVDPSGKETVLHSFDGPTGGSSSAGLIHDGAGNLYGTAWGGGAGGGTVFEIVRN